MSVEPVVETALAVKLQTDSWEVNVHASPFELMKLRGIRDARWDERRTIRAGTSAGAPVYWAAEGDDVTLMIGHDDETWDLAVTMPIAAVEEIVRAAERSQDIG